MGSASRLYCGSRVWVEALAGDVVLCSWARHLTLNSSVHPRYRNGYDEFNTGGNPAMY